MHRPVAMMWALGSLLIPASPAIEVANLATPEPAIVNVAEDHSESSFLQWIQ